MPATHTQALLAVIAFTAWAYALMRIARDADHRTRDKLLEPWT